MRSSHRMDIKVINLNSRPDRWETFQKTASEHHLEKYDRFSAVNGQLMKITAQHMHMLKNNSFGWRRGVVGNALSHIALWRELIQSSVSHYVIFEDDVNLSLEFDKHWPALQEMLALGKHPVVFVGYTSDKKHINPLPTDELQLLPLSQIKSIWGGSFAYTISKEISTKFIEEIDTKGLTVPIDTFMMNHPDVVYVANPSLVTSDFMTFTNNIDSDIHYNHLTIFDDYTFYPLQDSYGHDIRRENNTSFWHLKQVCDNDPECRGFNTLGYLKNKINDPSEFIQLPGAKSKTQGLYVKGYLH